MFIQVNPKVWAKKELLLRMWHWSYPTVNYTVRQPTDDELEVALKEYTVKNNCLYSKNDGRQLFGNDQGGCDSAEYIHYRPIKTSFYHWPFLDSFKYNKYTDIDQLETIVKSKQNGLIARDITHKQFYDKIHFKYFFSELSIE